METKVSVGAEKERVSIEVNVTLLRTTKTRDLKVEAM